MTAVGKKKKKKMIEASKLWNGFTFTFQNGWDVSVQQSENHYCKVPYSVEVAIIDDKDNWYTYTNQNNDIIRCEDGNDVNGHIGADELAKILEIVRKNG